LETVERRNFLERISTTRESYTTGPKELYTSISERILIHDMCHCPNSSNVTEFSNERVSIIYF